MKKSLEDMTLEELAQIAAALYEKSLKSAYGFFGMEKFLHINHTKTCGNCEDCQTAKSGPRWVPTFKFYDRPVTTAIAETQNTTKQIGFYPVIK